MWLVRWPCRWQWWMEWLQVNKTCWLNNKPLEARYQVGNSVPLVCVAGYVVACFVGFACPPWSSQWRADARSAEVVGIPVLLQCSLPIPKERKTSYFGWFLLSNGFAPWTSQLAWFWFCWCGFVHWQLCLQWWLQINKLAVKQILGWQISDKVEDMVALVCVVCMLWMWFRSFGCFVGNDGCR